MIISSYYIHENTLYVLVGKDTYYTFSNVTTIDDAMEIIKLLTTKNKHNEHYHKKQID